MTGSGLTYSLDGYSKIHALTGAPVTLNSVIPFAYSGYLSQVPVDRVLSGATLDLGVVIQQAQFSLLPGSTAAFYNPALAATLGPISLTITVGDVSRTLIGTSLTSYDLFANGFGALIAGGAPITITFNASDNVTESSFTYRSASLGRGVEGGKSEVLLLADNRVIVGTNTINFLTLYTVAEPDDSLGHTPEPMTMLMTGAGLLLLGYWRYRKQKQARQSAVTSVTPL